MSPTIQLSHKTYKRLETQAHGFDTPESVIERLLDQLEALPTTMATEDPARDGVEAPLTRPQPIFYPSNSQEFKRLLLEKKQAYRRITYVSGESKMSVWKAERFDESSSVLGNIYSGVLRDWQDKGIIRAEFAIEREDFPPIDDVR